MDLSTYAKLENYPFLYINKNGEIYNTLTGRNLIKNKNNDSLLYVRKSKSYKIFKTKDLVNYYFYLDKSEFYEIEGFSRYMISKDGRILSKLEFKILTNESKRVNKRKSYPNTTLKNDSGEYIKIKHHHLMFYAFRRNEYELINTPHPNGGIWCVDHINNNKLDYSLNNLELISSIENTRRWSERLKQGKVSTPRKKSNNSLTRYRVILVNVRTNEYKIFSSVRDFSLHIGHCDTALKNHMKLDPDGLAIRDLHYKYKYYQEGDELTYPFNHEGTYIRGRRKLHDNKSGVGICERDIITGIVHNFHSLTNYCRSRKIREEYVRERISNEEIPILYNYKQIKLSNNFSEWPVISNPHLEVDNEVIRYYSSKNPRNNRKRVLVVLDKYLSILLISNDYKEVKKYIKSKFNSVVNISYCLNRLTDSDKFLNKHGYLVMYYREYLKGFRS